tara:strand:+ start:144 stop:362 length:219 start_codon:yes stop_codon:yes gene_type:complete
MKKYIIEITPTPIETEDSIITERPYELELETDRLDWSMEQYQRNRAPLSWKVIAENDEWIGKSHVSAKIVKE